MANPGSSGPPQTPARSQVRSTITSPSKRQAQEWYEQVDNTMDLEEWNQGARPFFNMLVQRDGDPETQEAILAMQHKHMTEFVRNRNLRPEVLVSPDVNIEGAASAEDSASEYEDEPPSDLAVTDNIHEDDGRVRLATHEPATPSRKDKDSMYSIAALNIFGLRQGNGLNEQTPVISGSYGIPRYPQHSLDLSQYYTVDRLNEMKDAFVRQVYNSCYEIPSGGRTQFTRLHPHTVYAWADLLYGMIDTSGWGHLRQIWRSAVLEDEHGVTAVAGLQAERLARSEEVKPLAEFYHHFAKLVAADVKKGAYTYFVKAVSEYGVFRHYEALKREMDNPRSQVAVRINRSEHSVGGGGGPGRKAADKVKSYLAQQLQITTETLSSKLNTGKPVFIIVSKFGFGCLPLLKYDILNKLNKMVVGAAAEVVRAFIDDFGNDLDPLFQMVLERFTQPLMQGQIDRLRTYNVVGKKDEGSFTARVNNQLSIDGDHQFTNEEIGMAE